MKKKVCLVISILTFIILLSACTEQTDNQNNNVTTVSNEAKDGEIPKSIWEEVPEYKEVIDENELNKETFRLTVEKEKSISEIDDIFTDNVRKEMESIINQWYEKNFYGAKSLKQSEMVKLEVETFSTSVVLYEDKPMILVTFATSAMKRLPKDTINALLECSENGFTISELWYIGEYRFSKSMGM